MQISQILMSLPLPACIAIGYFICILVYRKRQSANEKKLKQLIEESTRAAEKVRKEAELAAKADLYQRREAFERETQETRMELKQQERRLSKREDNLERKMELLTKKERELDIKCAEVISKKITEAKENAEQTATSLISTAIQRCAATHTAVNIVSSIELPNNEMKGRIIGREGRNIRAFEKATGIDVIVDDTPGVIVLS